MVSAPVHVIDNARFTVENDLIADPGINNAGYDLFRIFFDPDTNLLHTQSPGPVKSRMMPFLEKSKTSDAWSS